MRRQYLELNLNDTIKFKILPPGRGRILDMLGTSPASVQKAIVSQFKEDKDGYCRAPLWDVAHTFGDLMFNGGPPPIETTILLEKDYDGDE